ncbi:MAG TPA: hypothetical protein VF619_09530 [Allosphingosinicella sp.]
MDAIKTPPWWVGFPASVGFTVMGIVAPTILPVWAQAWLFGAGALAVAGSALAGALHYLPDKAAPHMPFRELVRRVALHSNWGLTYTVREESWPTWQEDLKREILHKLAVKPPEALGIKNARGEPEDSGPTLIPTWFWAKADFFPEHMLADNKTGMISQKGDPCPLLYMDVTIRRADVDALWPAISNRRRADRVSAFAGLAREWRDTQEDARLNRNPGVGFDVVWKERAKLGDLSPAPSASPSGRDPPDIDTIVDAVRNGMHARNGAGASEQQETPQQRAVRIRNEALEDARAGIHAKAELMRDRLATRNHSHGSPEYDTPSTLSYLAALWDAEERGHIYDEYHRSSFTLGLGRGASRVEGDTIAEVQRNVMALKEKRRQAHATFHEKRRELIAKGRDVVHRWRQSDEREPFEVFASKDRAYLDVQPYLGDEYQAERARRGRTVVFKDDVQDYYAGLLLRELARLEKEWGLD